MSTVVSAACVAPPSCGGSVYYIGTRPTGANLNRQHCANWGMNLPPDTPEVKECIYHKFRSLIVSDSDSKFIPVAVGLPTPHVSNVEIFRQVTYSGINLAATGKHRFFTAEHSAKYHLICYGGKHSDPPSPGICRGWLTPTLSLHIGQCSHCALRCVAMNIHVNLYSILA